MEHYYKPHALNRFSLGLHVNLYFHQITPVLLGPPLTIPSYVRVNADLRAIILLGILLSTT